MILNIKMLKQNCLILAAVVLAGALSFSCFLYNLGDGGTLVVKLPGGDGSARALMDGFDKNGYLNELKYRITCSGQGSTAEREASAGGTVTLYLAAGRWDFTVTVINKNGREIGSDTRIVNIEAGKSVTVNDILVQLDEPIYMFTNTFTDQGIEQNNWATGNGNYCLKNYYSRTFVEDKQYRVNIKGTINVPMDDITLMLWLYTGSNPSADYNAADWKIIGHTWGSLNQKYLRDQGDFDATLDLLIDFNVTGNVLTPADKNLLKEPDRIYFELTSKMAKNSADIDWGTKKTAITHFNMIISDGMIFDMYVWSGDNDSGWSSGHGGNVTIKVVPDYLNSIKRNTQYKVTVKGRTNADLRGMNGQFWWAGNTDATNWDATYCLDDYIRAGDFECEIYLTTNNSITPQNQKEIIFNIVSNWQGTPSAESGTKKATISDFTMGIEEVTDVVYMRANYWERKEDGTAAGNYATSEQIKIENPGFSFEFGKPYLFHIEGVSSRYMEDLWCGFYYSDDWTGFAHQNIAIPKGNFSVSVVLTLNRNGEKFDSSKQDKAVLQIGYGDTDELINKPNSIEQGTIYATFNEFRLEVSKLVEKDGLYFFPIHNDTEYSVIAAGSISSDLVIPSEVEGKQVTEIFRECFKDRPDLTSVKIPKSIRRIDGFAFHGCESLASVTFEEGSRLQSIGEYAFSCYEGGTSNKLTSITLPDTVTSIETGAFFKCENLTNVVIGKNVNSIGVHAFLNCYKLTNVTIKAEQPPDLPAKASTDLNDDRYAGWFERNDPGRFFYVPDATNYKKATGWDQFQNCIFSYAEHEVKFTLTEWIKDNNYLTSPLQQSGNPDIAFINNGIEITKRVNGNDNHHTIDLLLTGEGSLNLDLNKDILKVTLYGYLLGTVNNAFVGIQRPVTPFKDIRYLELTGENPSFKLVWEQGPQIDDIYDFNRIRLGTGNADMRITFIQVEIIGTRNFTEYTVTFYDSEGNNFPDKTAFGGLVLGELPIPSERPGYTFMGWFDEDNNKVTAKTKVNRDMSLTARWEFGDKSIIVVVNPTTGTLFEAVGDWNNEATKRKFTYDDKDWWIVANTRVEDGNPWELPNQDIPSNIFSDIKELHKNGVTRLGYTFSDEEKIYDYITLTYDFIHISGDETCSVVIRRTKNGGLDDVNYPGLYGSDSINYEMSEFYNKEGILEGMSIIKNSNGNNYNGGSNKGVFLLRITEIKFTMEDPRIP